MTQLRGGHGGTCSADSCDREPVARGMCNRHYRRWWQANPGVATPRPRRRSPRPYAGPEPCNVDGCDKAAQKFRPHCAMHMARLRRHGNLDGLLQHGLSLAERVQRGTPTGLSSDVCWEWLGSRIAHTGYGAITGAVSAHRAAYEVHHGPIPEGMVVRHKCDNRPCVNPAHLELGTYADNSRDMIARGRGRATFGRLYTDEQRLEAAQAVQGGEPVTSVAARLGMSKQYVRTLAKKVAA